MADKLTKSIIFSLSEEFEKAVFRSRKRPRDIIRALPTLHPEVFSNPNEWVNLNQNTRNVILTRIRRTLNSLS
ncbi:MAG: hypothetical protein H6Q67_1545 [Firmicutes bacterium]|nr:hypothetical protein [Bacillota bacterium]